MKNIYLGNALIRLTKEAQLPTQLPLALLALELWVLSDLMER